ncbi:MAG: ribosomal-protein-alanine N-acetyltransferase [Gammaproteobacteria bacterium]|jgi:ribosomal-protein-alanine N-acetyltransferase
MPLQIRPATSEDQSQCLSFIAALRGHPLSDASASVFAQLLQQERGCMLVAAHGDQLFGVATVSFNLGIRFGGEYAQLEELYVSPQARGQNAGALLVHAIIDAAKHRGCAEIGLYLVESTTHNRPFYEKLGFRTVGDEMRQSLS